MEDEDREYLEGGGGGGGGCTRRGVLGRNVTPPTRHRVSSEGSFLFFFLHV